VNASVVEEIEFVILDSLDTAIAVTRSQEKAIIIVIISKNEVEQQ
jgi:hypothetical protein